MDKSNLVLFDNINFEVIEVDNHYWFQAKTVCDFLGFKNPSREIKSNCRDWHYKEYHFGNDGRPGLYLTVAGVCRLAMKSKNPKALEFQDWVTDDVLPSIIEKGGYLRSSATSEQVQALVAERDAQKAIAAKALKEKDEQALVIQKFFDYFFALNNFASEVLISLHPQQKEQKTEIIYRVCNHALHFIREHVDLIEDIEAFTIDFETADNPENAVEFVQKLIEHLKEMEEERNS